MTYHLQIVTPDGLHFDGQVVKILIPTINGQIGILARHINYVSALGMGLAKVVTEEETRFAACIGGMVAVTDGEVKVVATTFEWADEIDLARAEKARDEAQQRLDKMQSGDRDFSCVEAKLKRALTRIQSKG